MPMSLPFEADHTVNACLFLAAAATRPGRTRSGKCRAARRCATRSGSAGSASRRPAGSARRIRAGRRCPARYTWSWRLARLSAALGGVRLPAARFASVDEPAEIVDWMAGRLAAGRVPHIWTFVTSAVRVCQAESPPSSAPEPAWAATTGRSRRAPSRARGARSHHRPVRRPARSRGRGGPLPRRAGRAGRRGKGHDAGVAARRRVPHRAPPLGRRRLRKDRPLPLDRPLTHRRPGRAVA
jgi:hypothetical protein